jgi:hypothetical protein
MVIRKLVTKCFIIMVLFLVNCLDLALDGRLRTL